MPTASLPSPLPVRAKARCVGLPPSLPSTGIFAALLLDLAQFALSWHVACRHGVRRAVSMKEEQIDSEESPNRIEVAALLCTSYAFRLVLTWQDSIHVWD